MSKILKINSDQLEKEIHILGTKLYGEDIKVELILNDDFGIEHYDEIINFSIIDKNGNTIGGRSIKLISNSYNFKDEQLYGLYELVPIEDDSIEDKFEEISDTFNKVKLGEKEQEKKYEKYESRILKVNIDSLVDDLCIVGSTLFGDNSIVELNDHAFDDNAAEKEFDKVIDINKYDEDDNLIETVTIKQVHQQYDFENEILFGLYEMIYCKDTETYENFKKVTKYFNKYS